MCCGGKREVGMCFREEKDWGTGMVNGRRGSCRPPQVTVNKHSLNRLLVTPPLLLGWYHESHFTLFSCLMRRLAESVQ